MDSGCDNRYDGGKYPVSPWKRTVRPDEERVMNDLQERITERTRAEVRYLRGYQRMNLERFRYYQSEFQAAQERFDLRKMHEIVQDTVTISNDTIRLIRKRMAITARRSFSFAPNDIATLHGNMQLLPPPKFTA
jgi:hypothetical protein